MTARASLAAATCLLIATPAGAEVADLSFGSPQDSVSTFGAFTNDTLTFNLGLGSPVEITAVGWDMTLVTFGASWASDARIAFSDGATGPGATSLLDLTPGSSVNAPAPAPGISLTSGGLLALPDIGIPTFQLSTGVLQFEFYETVDDLSGADAQWNSTISVEFFVVPAPAGTLLIGLGGMALARRRR